MVAMARQASPSGTTGPALTCPPAPSCPLPALAGPLIAPSPLPSPAPPFPMSQLLGSLGSGPSTLSPPRSGLAHACTPPVMGRSLPRSASFDVSKALPSTGLGVGFSGAPPSSLLWAGPILWVTGLLLPNPDTALQTVVNSASSGGPHCLSCLEQSQGTCEFIVFTRGQGACG